MKQFKIHINTLEIYLLNMYRNVWYFYRYVIHKDIYLHVSRHIYYIKYVILIILFDATSMREHAA